MTVALHRVAPGFPAEAWLAGRLAELKRGDAFAPVTIVVPTPYAGQGLRRRFAATGAYANLRTAGLARLADAAGAGRLAEAGLKPLTAVVEEAAIGAAARQVGAFGAQAGHRSVALTLRTLFNDIADQELDEGGLERLAAHSSLARAAVSAYRAYREDLTGHGFYDGRQLYRAATDEVLEGRAAGLLAEWGPLVVYLPRRMPAAAVAFLKVVGSATTVEVAVAHHGDPDADALAEDLINALGVAPRGAEGDQAFPAAPPPPSLHVVIAVDPGDEVRATVREVLAAVEGGADLHRMAIAYRHEEPYARLTREVLAAAGLPYAGLEGRRLSDSLAGRGLLGLLSLRGQKFSRASVMRWLSSLPHGRLYPGLARWDRLSRDAGVVKGVGQWRERLAALAAEMSARRENEISFNGEETPLARRLMADLDALGGMERRILEWDRDTRTPAPTGWRELGGWALELRRQHLQPDASWPAAEVRAAEMVDEVIQGLQAAAEFDNQGGVELERFLEALEAGLRSRRQSDGILGTGVVVGSVKGMAGLAFDRVFFLGMTERSFPAPLPVDPLFPLEESADELGRARRWLAAERAAYLGLMSGATTATLAYPANDAEGRPAYPARWLLEAASALAGTPMGPVELREMAPQSHSWATVLVSAEAALRQTPVRLNLAERRVAEAVAAPGLERLRAAPLGQREDLPLAGALHLAAARRSSRFTQFDGNVAAVAASSGRLNAGLTGTYSISPTTVEEWATCPYRHFLHHVLGVEPTERPEDEESWGVDALDRGSLVHHILQDFFAELAKEGRPLPGEEYTTADLELVDRLAAERFKELENRGRTGYALAWGNEQRAILLDLQTLLRRDAEFRAGGGWIPSRFEQRFGWADPESWPPATVAIPAGSVSLRGYIDRIDQGPHGYYVTDYKTGRSADGKDFDADPVVAGTKVQLAAYMEAILAHLKEARLPPAPVSAAYWYVSAKGSFNRVEVDSAGAARRRLGDVLTVVDSALKAGAFPLVPGDEIDGGPRPGPRNCRYCDFNRVCPRNREQLSERKRGDGGSALHAQLALPPEVPVP